MWPTPQLSAHRCVAGVSATLSSLIQEALIYLMEASEKNSGSVETTNEVSALVHHAIRHQDLPLLELMYQWGVKLLAQVGPTSSLSLILKHNLLPVAQFFVSHNSTLLPPRLTCLNGVSSSANERYRHAALLIPREPHVDALG